MRMWWAAPPCIRYKAASSQGTGNTAEARAEIGAIYGVTCSSLPEVCQETSHDISHADAP